jgi:putative membrane protein
MALNERVSSNRERGPGSMLIHNLGLALISCGILALVISIWQYWWSIRYLWGEPYTPLAGVTKEGKQTPVIAVAIVLIGIGLFAFFAVLFRLT